LKLLLAILRLLKLLLAILRLLKLLLATAVSRRLLPISLLLLHWLSCVLTAVATATPIALLRIRYYE
jgi:hypothetical protein